MFKKKYNNVNIFNLNEGTKQLLGAMNFGPIPDEANYLAFFEDGSAQFIEALELSDTFIARSEMVFVSYQTGVTLEF